MTDNTGYQLLIVDNDHALRQRVSLYLEDAGFYVLQVSSEADARSLCTGNTFDAVILACEPTSSNDPSLLQWLRSKLIQCPVIVLSEGGTMTDVVDAMRLGATDYLVKPIHEMESLKDAIERSVDRFRHAFDSPQYRQALEQANRELTHHLRSIEQDQQAGLFVQQRLLPASPFTALDYTFSHYVKPSEYLSGDTTDYLIIDNRYWAFYLADVSGHGSAPAFVTIWLKNLIRQLIRNKHYLSFNDSVPNALQQLLGVINDELLDTQLNHHLTCFVGIVDTYTNELYYAIAGHLPLPVLITQESCQFLEGKGKPVGLFKQAEWAVHKINTEPEFSILCFSDGVLEILSPESLMEKEASLLDLVKATGGHLSSIRSCLTDAKLKSAPDDIAILSICKDVY